MHGATIKIITFLVKLPTLRSYLTNSIYIKSADSSKKCGTYYAAVFSCVF